MALGATVFESELGCDNIAGVVVIERDTRVCVRGSLSSSLATAKSGGLPP